MISIDDLTPEELAALECTARSLKIETQTFVAKISCTAGLLNAPEAPSLVCRHPLTDVTECVPIGAGLTVERGEGCEIHFEDRQELSRRHFVVRGEDGLFFVEDLGSILQRHDHRGYRGPHHPARTARWQPESAWAGSCSCP